MTDPDEAQLSKIAKQILATPHKLRSESKVGKPRAQSTPKARLAKKQPGISSTSTGN
jgi:hypothetical protein